MRGILVGDNGEVKKYGLWTVQNLLDLAQALEALALGVVVDFGPPPPDAVPPDGTSRERVATRG